MMRLTYAPVLALLLLCPLALLVACGDDDGDDDDTPIIDASTIDGAVVPDAPGPDASHPTLPEDPPAPVPTGDPEVTVVTYNTGLVGSEIVKGHKERKPLIIAALKALDADVICIQEAYNNEEDSNSSLTNPAELASQLADTYPHAFYSYLGNKPLGNGLVIVSKHPLYRGRDHLFVNQNGVVDRAVIAANVLTPGSYFTVICTHLQSGLDDVGVGNSVAVRMAEIMELFTWAMAEDYLEGPTFLLGDFNTGPDPVGACVTPGQPLGCCDANDGCTQSADTDNYDLLKTMFTDANDDSLGCTSCRDFFIPLQALSTFNNEPSQRIDHCFYVGLGSSVPIGGELVLDEPQSIAYQSETLLTLSDHYGVSCEFGIP